MVFRGGQGGRELRYRKDFVFSTHDKYMEPDSIYKIYRVCYRSFMVYEFVREISIIN